jgi:hypothetical protein
LEPKLSAGCLLFFEEKNMEAARGEFLKVIQRGNSNCGAQRYLGLIYHERKGVVDKEAAPDLRMPHGGEFDKLRNWGIGLSQVATRCSIPVHG